jgi:hypothetical protein
VLTLDASSRSPAMRLRAKRGWYRPAGVDTISEEPDATLPGAGVFPDEVSIAVAVEVTDACDVPLNRDHSNLLAPPGRGRLHRWDHHPHRLRAHHPPGACAGFPDAVICSGRMRSSRLGLCRCDERRLYQEATVFLCHGALLQPLDLRRVQLGRRYRTLPPGPSKRPRVFPIRPQNQ